MIGECLNCSGCLGGCTNEKRTQAWSDAKKNHWFKVIQILCGTRRNPVHLPDNEANNHDKNEEYGEKGFPFHG